MTREEEMKKEDIHKFNVLSSQWLYHEQELKRDSDEKYHTKEQRKIETLLKELIDKIKRDLPF